ncbi:hypothetical protein CWS72_17515 [Telmatospirillum siberiense]|uniref:Uncharacterized protein n=1 Tax=Telmatospirillum siberiense TaxID=382514 RepID=A0A2N3PS70_9PROT|nr:hypothetical protein CWS72_17515 [Telmatospirillum siberiense]
MLLLSGCETARFPVPEPKPPIPPAAAEASPPNATTQNVPAVSKQQSTAKSAHRRGEDKNGDGKKEENRTSPEQPSVQLIGLDETAVQAQLGAPTIVEDHPPGKIWRFRNRNCVLNLAFYPEVETRAFRVLSYEVTSDDHNAGAKQLCETKFGATVATE